MQIQESPRADVESRHINNSGNNHKQQNDDEMNAVQHCVTKNEYRPDRGTMIGRTLLERRPVQIEDVLEDPDYKAWDVYAAGHYRTMVGIPDDARRRDHRHVHPVAHGR
jgi:hypothetical protein